MAEQGGFIDPHGGFRKLKSFQTAEIVYDVTVAFCNRLIDRRSRTHDQMVQAARSGRQNIAEGSVTSGTSKKTELKLVGVARASLEELLLDYQDFLRQKDAIENRLHRLLERNPLRTDFQRRYEEIVAEYNREKDRLTIERTFEELLRFVEGLGGEEARHIREGLDEESLAVFDLLKKSDLGPAETRRVKAVAVGLLDTLKAEKLRIDHWLEKEATRDAVRIAVYDFLYSDKTGLPVSSCTEGEVESRSEDVYRHIYWAYPMLPSPYYGAHV
jgi:type I restriction enzyme R subunit